MKTKFRVNSLTGASLVFPALLLLLGGVLLVSPAHAGYQEYTVASDVDGAKDVYPVDLDEDLDEDLVAAIYFEDQVISTISHLNTHRDITC